MFQQAIVDAALRSQGAQESIAVTFQALADFRWSSGGAEATGGLIATDLNGNKTAATPEAATP